jgi:hypothetical protein
MMVKITRVPFNDEHMDQKFLVLQGLIDGHPQLTKTVTINTSALADGTLVLADIKAKLIADVEEYHTRWVAVQQALTEL